MLSFLPSPIRGILACIFLLINTVFWALPLFAFALCKFLVPVPRWRRFVGRLMNEFASYWIGCNNLGMYMLYEIQWHVQGIEGLQRKQWYLVVANHQSWIDILVLQKIFYRRIPFLKFFLKQELIWLPILGQAWWALDFPFMKRYSREYLNKHPHLQGKDIESTRKSCKKFRHIPVAIMNFVEGTRFSKAKHRQQQSPYLHLLKPKAGGIAFVLATMGEQLCSILNVTIVYPQGTHGFWHFACGKVKDIRVKVEQLPIPKDITGEYFENLEIRKQFQSWLNSLWQEKDKICATLLAQDPSSAPKRC